MPYAAEVNLSSMKFADDVTGITVCNTETQVQKSLEIMMDEYKQYFSAHGLRINVTKCEHIVIGSPRRTVITVDGREEASKVKLLGLTFTKAYKFDDHVDNITEKMAKRNGQLTKLTKLADKQTLLIDLIDIDKRNYTLEV